MVHFLHQHASLRNGRVKALLFSGPQVGDLGSHQQDLTLVRGLVIRGVGRHEPHIPHTGAEAISARPDHFAPYPGGKLSSQFEARVKLGPVCGRQPRLPLCWRVP